MEPMEEKKDFLTIFNTIVLTVTSIVTAFTAYRTSTLNDKINNLKAVSQEGQTISAQIEKLTTDTTSTLKYDYAFLTLERYLKNTSEDGKLKPQDKEMLIGFAQSLILDRINSKKAISDKDKNKLLIPKQFLQKNDTVALNKLGYLLEDKNKTPNYPTTAVTSPLASAPPVSQIVNLEKSKSISLVLNKVVYLQYSNGDKIDDVKLIQKNLKDKGWISSRSDLVKGTYSNVIKFFHSEDRELAFEIKKTIGEQFRIVEVKNFEKKVPVGQLEVWINNK
jgi:hypothetical protein